MRKALSFLTPFGRAATPTPATLAWFPVVGALIGLGVGATWWLARTAWPASAAAAIAVAADAALTGGLHLDGLADTADGLLPPLERRRRLDVMADPAVGAFGMVAVVVVLVLRFGAFGSMRPAPLVVGALWCGSRTAMALVARLVPYVRPGGLASAFTGTDIAARRDRLDTRTDRVDDHSDPRDTGADPPPPGGDDRYPDGDPLARGTGSGGGARAAPRSGVRTLLLALSGAALAVGLAVAGRGARGLVVLGVAASATCAVVLFARRRIGGFTGDVLGAAGVAGETAGLLVLAIKW